MAAELPGELVADLFRRESGRLVAALTRVLGPAHLALAEDVVQDALVSAMQAWRFGLPRDPVAWILQVARNRAIDLLRRDRRLAALRPALESEREMAAALAPDADPANQLAMMFSICDEALAMETHVTLILRLLCGLSAAEIARAFLVDTQTIDRRLHRGRARLQELGRLADVSAADEARARRPSVLRALYLLFNEGYHGSDARHPLHPAMCADALRLVELMLASPATGGPDGHALAALFCLSSARLPTRLDNDGAFVPLVEQDRARWDRALIERGVLHLSQAATGDELTRWHLEAGIACEHTLAPSVAETDWRRIVDLYDALLAQAPGPIVAMNRAVAIAELRGLDAGREALRALEGDEKLSRYTFYFAARADIERRAGKRAEARRLYERALDLARSRAERLVFQKKIAELEK